MRQRLAKTLREIVEAEVPPEKWKTPHLYEIQGQKFATLPPFFKFDERSMSIVKVQGGFPFRYSEDSGRHLYQQEKKRWKALR